MPKFAGVSQVRAVAAFQRVGFRIIRQSGHIVMSDGEHLIVIPRHSPVNAITMGNIIRDAGLTNDEFRALL